MIIIKNDDDDDDGHDDMATQKAESIGHKWHGLQMISHFLQSCAQQRACRTVR